MNIHLRDESCVAFCIPSTLHSHCVNMQLSIAGHGPPPPPHRISDDVYATEPVSFFSELFFCMYTHPQTLDVLGHL